MATEVTDPALLEQLNGTPGDAPAAPAAPAAPGKEVTDPALLSQLNEGGDASPLQHPNSTPTLPMDTMPFGDQVSLAGLDNVKEYQHFLGHKYGDKNVTMDWSPDGQPQLIVQTPQGKYRVGGPADNGPSFIAKLTSDVPEMAGTIAGGVIGTALGGPGAGTILGAGIGSGLMHVVKETQKAEAGNLDKNFGESVTSSELSVLDGMSSEAGGQVAGKLVGKALTARLPRFITGATDESVSMTKAAVAAGGKPSYSSMAPGATHLRRIEALGQKLAGTYVQQDKANMAFVRSELAKKLRGMGYPPEHVESFLDAASGPEHTVSNSEVGNGFKESVEAYRNTMVTAIDRSAKAADEHIDAQLKLHNEKIAASKGGDLTGDFAAQIDSANQDFKSTATKLYDRMDQLVGKSKIVPTEQVAAEAKKIVELIRETSPSQVSKMVADISKQTGKKVSEEDAILMTEFGVEIPQDGGKWSLPAAQRLRTVLRDKANGNKALMANSTQHDYGQLAQAVDRAIQDAAQDPQAKAGIEALNRADKFWKDNVRKFDDAKLDNVIEQIKGGAPPDPEKLVQMISGGSSSARIARLKRTITMRDGETNADGEALWKRIQGTHLETFMRPFEVKDMEGKTVTDGMALLQKLRSGDVTKQIDALHGEGTAFQMEEIARMLATRQGKLDPAVLMNGGPKEALTRMKADQARLDEYMKSNALRILANPDMTGEEAYQWIARGHGNGGDDSRIQAVIQAFGEKSPQMAGVRQAALEEVARNASLHAIDKGGNSALENALKQYSPAQLKELFPEGMAEDMRHISDVIKFMFPFKSGMSMSGDMPGMAAGSVQGHKFFRRNYEIAMAGIMRFIVLHPSAVKWIVTGREEGEEAWMRGTADLFRKMTTVSSQIGEHSLNDQSNSEPGPAPPAARPGQQPPTPMPGPPTVQ